MSPPVAASEAEITRFRADLETLTAAPLPEAAIGVAVSGGVDSLALLLIADTAYPDAIRAATVDHGLRRESADEARAVARVCTAIGVPHTILHLSLRAGGNVQARAREARYAALAGWARAEGIGVVATAHHLDDQAETVLMRLARGSGMRGLAAMRPKREMATGCALLRPLLGWRRTELDAIVARAGLTPVADPSNHDPRFDRTAARALLANNLWLAPERLAAAAEYARDAEDALAHSTAALWQTRSHGGSDGIALDVTGLPHELERRLAARAIRAIGGGEPRGPQLTRLVARLRQGRKATLGGVAATGGAVWRFAPAPPRRRADR